MQSQQDIHILDFKRLMMGQTPATFLIEVAFRAIVTYVLLLVATRMMGKRVAGQLSVMEMTVLITLGAAIGVPLQAPERGLLAAVVILIVAIIYQWGLNLWSFRSRRAELLIQGDVTILVRDGRMDLAEMKRQALSHERLYSALRQAGIVQLGEVRRAYMEADGHFSIYHADHPGPGLCLIPEQDRELYESEYIQRRSFACRNCGHVVHGDESQAGKQGGEPDKCPICGVHSWSPAVETNSRGKSREEDKKSTSKPGPMGNDQDATTERDDRNARGSGSPVTAAAGRG